ncbi:KAP family P-loop NTPase fold protein, partial [Clostridium baratii]
MDKEITFKSDLLNRRLLAENLTKIIEKTNKMNVIAIDSSWGSGKTTFIKMWNNMLLEDGYKDKFRTLYFNAWKNDYLKDPLLALITEIDNECKKNNKISAKVFNGIINNGKKIIKPVINVSLKVATGGVLGNDDLKFGDIQEKVYNDAVQEKEKREEFIKYLEDNSKSDDYKTIFFIDELDRCRPLFAIELLETIKHLFKAKNIYFVIAIDKEQLSYSISTLYGHGMDSNGYLRRFFDLEYKMPIVDKRKYIT